MRASNSVYYNKITPEDAMIKLMQDAMTPFEWQPTTPGEPEVAVLLIHGLLDCPFSYREIARHLCDQGMLVRAMLLPGHGTRPDDLLTVTYEAWVEHVRENINALKPRAKKIVLMGYSTGAALSVYHALLDESLAGIVLLSPAIKVKVPVNVVVTWHHITAVFSDDKDWLCREDEIDYAKYRSVPFNAVHQVNALTDAIQDMQRTTELTQPVCMVVSREDETISAKDAIQFFENTKNPASRLLLYTASANGQHKDTRVTTRITQYPDLNIQHFSHTCLPFSANNPHYGQHGDYVNAAHLNKKEVLYGAYNRIEVDFYDLLYRLGLTQHKRRELTYNPDFTFMMETITQFIWTCSDASSNKQPSEAHPHK